MKINKSFPLITALISAGVLLLAFTMRGPPGQTAGTPEMTVAVAGRPTALLREVKNAPAPAQAEVGKPVEDNGAGGLWVSAPAAMAGTGGTPVFTSLPAEKIRLFTLSPVKMRAQLGRAPLAISAGRPVTLQPDPVFLPLPMPNGTIQRFQIEESSMMEPGLAAKFPEIKTYSGQGVDDPAATVQLDFTTQGFHAQVRSPSQGTWLIDPFFKESSDVYISHFKSDHARSARDAFVCEDLSPQVQALFSQPVPEYKVTELGTLALTGPTLRTFRLAVSATGEYVAAVGGGTVAGGQSAIVTAINRVNGIYEQELAIRFVLVANNNLLVFTDAATDGFTDNVSTTIIVENQTKVDNVIGSANYDIGHVFSTGGGGRSGQIGNVCQTGMKAMCVTGKANPLGDAFYVDYVAHEIGHQFGGNHTFNGPGGSCSGGSWTSITAHEPGSGSTIMAYAGICAPNDLQPNSDPYFHAVSLLQIRNYVVTGLGTCATQSASGNAAPVAAAGADFTIPARTPFALTGSGTDANSDALTYSWEEIDLGTQAALTDADNGTSPLFRVYPPTASPSRTFPRLATILSGTPTNAEKLPVLARVMNFRLTVRDNRSGGGGVDTDDMKATVVDTGAAFAVTAPAAGATWTGPGTTTVTWNVAGTTGNGINTANVNVLLSTDGGLTFPTTLASNVPNSGSATVNIPAGGTGTGRVKVEAVGNVFFAISPGNFNITAPPAVTITSPTHGASVKVFPTLSGTATAGGTAAIAGNVVNLTLYHVPTGQYWAGTSWSATAASLSVAVNVTTHIWTWTGGVPNTAAGTLRPGRYSLAAGTQDTTGLVSIAQTGVNNIFFDVDTNPPTGSISAPGNGTVIDATGYGFAGSARDDEAMGRVILFIRRNADNLYWNGTTWLADSLQANLASTLSGEIWTSNFTHPVPGAQMPNGSYNFIALIDDAAGNRIQRDAQVTVDYHPVFTWTGATFRDADPNNDSHSWGTPGNWLPSEVPGLNDIVQIDNGDAVQSTISRTVHGLRLGGGSSYGGYAVTVTGGGGSSVWSGGIIAGQLLVAVGARLTIDTKGNPLLGNGGGLSNSGTIEMTDTGAGAPGVLYGDNVTLNNSGTLLIARNGVILENYSTVPTFNNTGTVVKTTGSGVATIGWKFNNNGAAGADSGTLAFAAGSSPLDAGMPSQGSAGNFTAGTAAARVEFSGGTHVLKTGARFTGPGRGRISGGTVAFTGASEIGTAVLAAGGFEIAGGTMSGAGSLTVVGGGGTVAWTAGTMSTALTVGAGANLAIDTSLSPILGNGGTLTNAGAGSITGTASLYGDNATFNNSGTLVIARNGVVLENYSTVPTFNNTGSVVKTTGSGVATIGWKFNNNGAAGADSGTLAFAAGSSPLDAGIPSQGSAGNFTAGTAAARVEFSGGTHVLKAGAKFTGPGRGRISGGIVDFTGAAKIGTPVLAAGGFEIAGGWMSGAGSLTVVGGGGTVTWTAGTMSTALTVGAGGNLAIDTSLFPLLGNGGTLTNAGAGSISGTGSLYGDNATFNNSGTLVIARDGVVLENYATVPTFNNTGTVVKTTGSGVATIGWKFNNNGAAGADSGTLAFAAGSSVDGGAGNFTAGTAAARVEFSGGTHILKTGARFTGPGRGRISGGIVDFTGAAEIGSPVLAAGGFEIAGGTMSGAGSLTVVGGGGTVAWTAGTMSTALTVGAGANLAIDTSLSPLLGNGGTLTNAGAGSIAGTGYLYGDNATFNNSGTLLIARDGAVFSNYATVPTFNNTGTVVKTTGSGVATIGWKFNNNGAAGADSGTLAFAAGSSVDGGAGNFTAGTAAARVEFSGGTHILKTGARFTGPGRGRISGGIVDFTGAAEIGTPVLAAGGFEIAGGWMSGAGSLTVVGGGGTVAWTVGTMSTTLTVGAGANLAIDTSLSPLLGNGGTLTNAGAGSIAGTGYLYGDNATFNNSGTLLIARDGAVFSNYATVPTFNNTGTVVKTTGSGVATIGWKFNNNGAAGADSGTLAFAAGSSPLDAGIPSQGSAGNFTAGTAAARVEFSGGTHVLKTGARFTGPGRGRISGGIVDFTGTAEIGSPVLAAGGFEIAGGWMSGAGSLTVVGGGGTVAWTAGTMSTALTVGAGANLAIDTSLSPILGNGGTLTNAGAGSITGTGAFYGDNATFNNSGTLVIARDGAVLQNYATVPTFNNTGSVVLGGSASIITLGWKFTQSATGILNLRIGGTNPATPQFDQINFGQPCTLGGRLAVTAVNGFVPVVGNTFKVMTWGARTGSFSAVTTPGLWMAKSYNSADLTLTSVATPATLAEWKAYFFPAGGAAALDGSDTDFDGVSTIVEYATGTDPTIAGLAGMPVPAVTPDNRMSLTFSRRLSNDVTYLVEGSPDLQTWSPVAQLLHGATVWTGPGTVTEVVAGGACTCKVVDAQTLAGPGRYLRLRILNP